MVTGMTSAPSGNGHEPRTFPISRAMAERRYLLQNREAANKYYLATPGIVQNVTSGRPAKKFGRTYHLFDFHVGAPDADKVIVLMGSCAEAGRDHQLSER